jgi:ABC-type branched-subunit amino acid transport system substrate-binding protein
MDFLSTLRERPRCRTCFRNGLQRSQVLLFFLVSAFSAPEEVHLGGLFAFYRMSGEAVPSGQQRLAVFLMAVKEINNSTSILPQTKIKVSVKDTKYDVGKTFFSTLDLASSSFSGKGVDACIGAATSVESDVAATVFSKFSTVLVSYAATSPLLSTKINSPFFARTCPSDSFQGAAMAALVANYYGW